MDLQLAGRTFIVTGGSAGLGFATAQVLVAEGAKVVLSGRSEQRLAAAVEALGPRAVSIAADNGAHDTPQRLIAAAIDSFGRLDGALISVGGPPAHTFLETTDEQWASAVDSVFLGTVRLLREIAQALGEGGSLAVVLSSSVRQPLAGLAISNALRPGLAMVAKTLADEVGDRGIRVNGLLPGRIDTARVQELDNASGDADAARARHEASIPLRRYGQPGEFGRIAAFVLSPAASYLTGANIPIDGGLLRGL